VTKGFPIAAAPPALAWVAARYGRRTVLQAAGALLAALALPVLLALAISPSGTLEAVEYQLERPVQLESAPATGVLLLDAVGAGEAQSVKSHRSDGLEHPAAGPLAAVSLLAMLVALAMVVARSGNGPRALVLAALTAVLAFAALGKVLSPQYLLWLVPLAALSFAWRLHALAAALAAAAVLTQLEFPVRYFDLVGREPVVVALVALRNIALLTALALALRELVRGRQQHLLDGERPPVGVAVDDHRVEPRVLV
jgi:MFS family permease